MLHGFHGARSGPGWQRGPQRAAGTWQPVKKSRRSGKLRERRPPTISLCVIARDEEAFIGDCLASAQPFVDEIIVLDTGSTDRRSDIARAYAVRVETFAWQDDFSAARNAAIDLA